VVWKVSPSTTRSTLAGTDPAGALGHDARSAGLVASAHRDRPQPPSTAPASTSTTSASGTVAALPRRETRIGFLLMEPAGMEPAGSVGQAAAAGRPAAAGQRRRAAP
jgi:hypothetical protein